MVRTNLLNQLPLERRQYIMRHLPTILIEDGQIERLYHVLTDYNFLEKKIESFGLQLLLDDYELFSHVSAMDSNEKQQYVETLKEIQNALRLSAHVLKYKKRHLASQLWGRLVSIKTAGIQDLLEQARLSQTGLWLRPVLGSLAEVLGPLRRTIYVGSSLIAENIRVLSITPDGRRAASGSDDSTVRVWDLETGRLLRFFEGNYQEEEKVRAVAITPDGNKVIAATLRGTLKLWNVETGGLLQEYNGMHHIRGIVAHFNPTIPLVLTADGRRAIFDDGTLVSWDLETGHVVHRYKREDPEKDIDFLTVTPDGRKAAYVAGNYGNSTIKICDLEADRKLDELKITVEDSTTRAVTSLAITPDGNKVISASEKYTGEYTLKIWDLETHSDTILGAHEDQVYAVTVLSNGKEAISVSKDSYMIIWDLVTRQMLYKLQIFKGSRAWFATQPVAVTPDGSIALSASTDNNCIRLWDLKKRDHDTHYTSSYPVTDTAITPNGGKAISGSKDGMLKIWDTEKGQILQEIKGHYSITVVAISSDGRRAYSGSKEEDTSKYYIQIWDLEKGEESQILETKDEVVAFSSDGRRAILSCRGLYGGEEAAFKVLDLKTREIIYEVIYEVKDQYTKHAAITPNGRRAVFTIDSNTISVVDLETGKHVELDMFNGDWAIDHVSISPDGRVVSGGSHVQTLLMDLGNTKFGVFSSQVKFGVKETYPSVALAMTNGGKRVILAQYDRKLELMDGELIASFAGEEDDEFEVGEEVIASFAGDYTLSSCDISEDGSKLIAGDKGGNVHILHLEGYNKSSNESSSVLLTGWKKYIKGVFVF